MFNKKNFFISLSVVLVSVGNIMAAEAQQPNPIASFMPLILIFVIFYFFMIRPQQKQAKAMRAMLDALKRDDKVLTTGGLFGTVSAIKGTVVELKIAEGVKVHVQKSAIVSIVNDEVVVPELVKG